MSIIKEFREFALRVSDVQIAVRLRRETCDYAVVLAAGKIRFDDFLKEVQSPRLRRFRCLESLFHSSYYYFYAKQTTNIGDFLVFLRRFRAFINL